MKIKITNKLLVCFLLVSMVPLAVVGFVAYRAATGAIRNMILDRLETLAQERVDRIERLFAERKDDAILLARVPGVLAAMEDLIRSFSSGGINSPEYRETEGKYRPLMTAFSAKAEIHDLILISANGDVVFSLAKERDLGTNLRTGRYKDTELARVYNLGREGQEGAISEIRIYEPSHGPAVFLAAPVKDGGRLVGVLAIQMPIKEIDAVAGDYGGLKETGETVLISARENETIWVAPTRHDPGAAFTRRLRLGSESAIPAQEASSGKNGRGAYPDYRGKPILAAWRHMPALRLGLVIKMDEAEALAPIRTFTAWFLFLGLGTSLAVLAVSLLIARSISNPILALTRAAGRMAGGDMTVRTDIRSGDEIGALGTAFNDMAASLEEARRESEETDWLKTGIARLNEAMSGDLAIDTLASNVISEVTTYLGAQLGALYLTNDGADPTLSLMGSYAYKKRKDLSNLFKLGEGLVGQAALEKTQILVKNVPDDYVKVTSGLGERIPRFICVTPFLYEGRVKGVIEIGNLNEMTDEQLEYLEQAMPALAVAVESTEGRTNLAGSLEESQRLSEELQAQQEELRTTNEELEEQAQRLTESEERLKGQQEELEVTNEELDEKNKLLERQKKEVERARKDIEKQANELAVAGKYKSEFLSNMSHELRTPLNSLLLLAESLAENKDGNLSDEQEQSAKIIHSSGGDLLNLINEILDLSKIEAGRTDLHVAAVSISELADGTRAAFQHLAQEKGLSLEVGVAAEAPAEIVTDRKRVEQVIKNLVSNAIKFTESGGVTVRFGRPAADANLSRSGLSPSQTLSIAVTDTGVGIAPEQHNLIFEAFQQADGGTSRKYGGTGLGLSISREIAHLLGGEIQLHSRPERGSTFTLFVPVALTEDRGSVPGRPVTVPRADSRAPGPPTQLQSVPVEQIKDDRETLAEGDKIILIIEDDPDFARVLCDKCHENGFKCVAAPTGEAGLELAGKHLPDGILLDIRLPGMDGWAVMSALKDDTRVRHIPVHVVSVEEASTDSIRKGAIGHLTKPPTREELDEAFRRIEEVLRSSVKRVLVVEDDPAVRSHVVELIRDGDVKVDEAANGEQAIDAIRSTQYGCVILDLGLPDMDGRELLKRLEREGTALPPIIIHTAMDLTPDQEMVLREHADSIVLKEVRSTERLLDEVSLFLHRMVSRMPERKKQIIRSLHETDELLKDKKVLIVDDDMRTVFALSRLLTERGMKPLKAETGARALALLEEEPDVDLVLMDIMMPEMDGYEAMTKIRERRRFRGLPIIALTAKAMEKDREDCLAAGANDYMAKPVDQERLISMLRVWLYR